MIIVPEIYPVHIVNVDFYDALPNLHIQSYTVRSEENSLKSNHYGPTLCLNAVMYLIIVPYGIKNQLKTAIKTSKSCLIRIDWRGIIMKLVCQLLF